MTDDCFPYGAGTGSEPSCSQTCADSEDWATAKHFASEVFAINGVENMQKEIMTNGPIEVSGRKQILSHVTCVL